MTALAGPEPVPVVDFLMLGPDPHLVAHECTTCGARYFDRRNGCARCHGDGFATVRIGSDGEVVSFTIVAVPTPGIDGPFVAAVVDCGGTLVRCTLLGVEPSPAQVRLGMRVRFTTRSLGRDAEGVEGVTFAFQPVLTEAEAVR